MQRTHHPAHPFHLHHPRRTVRQLEAFIFWRRMKCFDTLSLPLSTAVWIKVLKFFKKKKTLTWAGASCPPLSSGRSDFCSDCPWSRTAPHRRCERRCRPCRRRRRSLPEAPALHSGRTTRASQGWTALRTQNLFLWTTESKQRRQLDLRTGELGKATGTQNPLSSGSGKLSFAWFGSCLPPSTVRDVAFLLQNHSLLKEKLGSWA